MAENEIFKSGKMSVDVAPRTVGILKTSIQFSTRDQGTAKLIFSLSKDGLPLPLSSAATVKVFLRMADGSVFEKTVSIVDQINGKLEYVLEEEISHPGLAKGELIINYANGQALSVCKFSFNIDASLMDQDIVPLAEYYVKDFNTLQSDIQQRAAVINETVDEMQEKVDAFESTAVTLDPRLTTVEEKVATATTQLAEKAKQTDLNTTISNVTDNAKQIKGVSTKLSTINTPLKRLEKFDDDLFNFDYTPGIKVIAGSVAGTKQITIDATATRPNHTNAAVYNAINNVRGYEVEFEPNVDVTKIRLGFANSVKDFSFINFTTGEYYLVNGGTLTTAINNPYTPVTFVAGDKIKLLAYGMKVLVFKNGVLVSIVTPHSSFASRKLDAQGKNFPAIVFRSGAAADVYGVNKLKVFQKYPKFMHFSYDDEIGTLQRLTTGLPTSIFDMDTFAFMKSMHDKYGAVFTINLFYKYDDSFNLSNVTANYINEFRANSDWMKFAFHGYDGVVDYNTIDSATAKTHYDNTMSEIARFASPQCIDTMPRASMFGGNLANVRAWRDTANYGITGLLSADDTRNSYYHSNLQRDALIACDDLYDEPEKLFFMRSNPRLDAATNVYQTLENEKTDITLQGQQDAKIMFWHASWTWSSQVKQNVEDCCKWARDNGYVFLFPMNVNPKF
ncbi:phage baseplate upper protein [Peribacillus frigoritolerans]|uniref:phage baseplate upper protein n=1 Tax=Peribacillus frigoritolerans TaxID=450367 RepID=UPI0030165683